MLSIGVVSSGQAASGYYKSEGYYVAESKEAEQSATYHGEGAEDVGLTGRVDDEAFSALLDGQTPDGRLLGKMVDGERVHRSGLDLTFSAPKGVSIAALVGGDTRILEAHTEAVKAALDYAEKHLIETRKMVNGEKFRETGGKIIAGLFQHDTSRALDPNLHTHAVIANVIKDRDGTYRSMSNERFFKDGSLDGQISTTKFLGQIYRNELAANLEALGYQTQRLGGGLFDITSVPKELIDHFSKRSAEIQAALDAKGLDRTTVNSQLAALATLREKSLWTGLN